MNGTDEREGRVEFHYNSTWWSVCDEGWDTEGAMVVCRQLGYPPDGAKATNNPDPSTAEPQFGQGSGLIWPPTGVNCTGTELTLSECLREIGFDNHSCSHRNDAGVICSGT